MTLVGALTCHACGHAAHVEVCAATDDCWCKASIEAASYAAVLPRHATYCLAYVRTRPGRRCGNPDVADGELIMCLKHSRRTRERKRLRERVEYGGHLIARDWRANDGSLRADWHFYVAEHMQAPDATHSQIERLMREEIDRCNRERFARCNVPVLAPHPHASGPDWDRFKLSRGDFHE